MAVNYSTTLKTTRMTAVRDAIDGGSGAGTIEIGTSGMATVLAVLTLSDPCGSVSGATLTFSVITSDSSADATGTAAEARIKDSAGNVIVSGLTIRASPSAPAQRQPSTPARCRSRCQMAAARPSPPERPQWSGCLVAASATVTTSRSPPPVAHALSSGRFRFGWWSNQALIICNWPAQSLCLR